MNDLWQEFNVSRRALTVAPCASLKRNYLKVDFFCEYEGSVDLLALDESLVAIPFLLAIAPTVWFSGESYRIPGMPADLFDSLCEAKSYIQQAYPSHDWSGEIVPDELLSPDTAQTSDRVFFLYSGGVDSAFSRLRYPQREHTLVCVWGADIPLSQHTKWEALKSRVSDIAASSNADTLFVRSNLEHMIKQKAIAPDISLWWSNIQHGPGLVGLAYPAAIAASAERIVLSSSNNKNYDPPWGSHPKYEGVLKAASIRVMHEGFDKDRKDKLYALVHETAGRKTQLAVCQAAYTDQTNCCACEKCLRTIAGLLLEGAEPSAYGFPISGEEACKRMEDGFAYYHIKMTRDKADDWCTVQARAEELSGSAANKGRQDLINWLRGMNFIAYNRRYERKHWWEYWLRRQLARVPFVFDIAREIHGRWLSRR